MTSFSSISIIATCFLPFFVLCIATPTPKSNTVFDDCERESMNHVHTMEDCFQYEFMPEKLNETAQLFSGSKCLKCNHICRIKDALMSCIREVTPSLKILSERARHMVPFLERSVDEALSSFCENIAEMIPVYGDEENSRCFRESGASCRSHTQPLKNLEDNAFCDSSNPEISNNSQDVICQSLMNYLQCKEKAASSCTVEVKNAITRMITILRNTESCSKHL